MSASPTSSPEGTRDAAYCCAGSKSRLLLSLLGLGAAFAAVTGSQSDWWSIQSVGAVLCATCESGSPIVRINRSRSPVPRVVARSPPTVRPVKGPRTVAKKPGTAHWCGFSRRVEALPGRWIPLGSTCNASVGVPGANQWSGGWCRHPERLRSTRGVVRQANPHEYFQPTGCQLQRFSRVAVARCLREKRVAWVGASTMHELFIEAQLRLLGPSYYHRYDAVHPPGKGHECPVRNDRFVDPKGPPCVAFRYPLDSSAGADMYMEAFSGGENIERVTVSYGGLGRSGVDRPQDTDRPQGNVTLLYLPNKHNQYLQGRRNFGGVGTIGKPPLSKALDAWLVGRDTIVFASLVHCMGHRRSLAAFGGSTEAADAYFDALLRTFERELQEYTLPTFLKWLRAGKRVVYWSEYAPSRSGSRALLGRYYAKFNAAAMKAVARFNKEHQGEGGQRIAVEYVDTQSLTVAQGHNETRYTDGIHYGDSAILPKHRATSTIVAKMTFEVLLNAICGVGEG